MKILLVSNYFPPTHNAGTEKRTLGYALQLKKLGFDPQVVCAGNWDVGSKYWNGTDDQLYMDIPVRRVNLNWKLYPDPNKYLYQNPIIADHFAHWLDEWQPDLVHVTSCYTLTASVIQKVKDRNLPLVLTLTDYWFICPKHTLLKSNNSLCNGLTSNFECQDCMLDGNENYRQFKRYFPLGLTIKSLEFISKYPVISKNRGMRGMLLDMGERKKFLSKIINIPDEVIAPSQYLADVYNAGGVSRNIRVIKSGHDLSWLKDANGNEPADGIRLGYIGQILPTKGLHILVSAFALNKQNWDTKLLVYGDHNKDTRYTAKLTNLIMDSENEILLRGSFPHEQLGEVLSGIDMLVVPSLWHENNPRVIQEAFASGTPVIASDVGGISEFVRHDVNGLLFERGNESALSNQISRVLEEPHLITKLRSGIEPVKKIETEVEEIVKIYQGLIRSQFQLN